jgi:hypothetical protein
LTRATQTDNDLGSAIGTSASGCSSVGRACACQAQGRRFETDHPLHKSDSKNSYLDGSSQASQAASVSPSPTYHPFLAVNDPRLSPTGPTQHLYHNSGFAGLASRLFEVAHAVHCEELCSQTHLDCGGCEHLSHACGCPHSELYDFDWEPASEEAERWPDGAIASLLSFISKLNCSALSADEIGVRLQWWWRGENRTLRKAMESSHRRKCERGHGVLINRVTGEQIPNRCKSWRDCNYCAWLYGASVERLFKTIRKS